MSNLDYDFCRSSWVGDYDDPNTFLDMFVTGGGNNDTGFASPAYDALIAEAAREVGHGETLRRFSGRGAYAGRGAGGDLPALSITSASSFTMGTAWAASRANLLDEHPLKEMYWKDRRPLSRWKPAGNDYLSISFTGSSRR